MRISELKRRLRREIEDKRNQLSTKERELYSATICRYLINLPQVSSLAPGDVLLTYMPIKAEVDVKPVMEWAWERKVTVLLPRVIADPKGLMLHRIEGYEELTRGPWNILEPKEDAPRWNLSEAIDVALIPGVAYDRFGYRLGHGGGYYDRLWGQWNDASLSAQAPFLVAPAYQVQIVQELPLVPHDMRVHCIVTDSGPL